MYAQPRTPLLMLEKKDGLPSVSHLVSDALVKLIDIASRRDLEGIIALRRQPAWDTYLHGGPWQRLRMAFLAAKDGSGLFQPWRFR